MFGVDSFIIALAATVVIVGMWLSGFILGGLGKFVWAWVDDATPGRNLFLRLIGMFKKPIWRYPVYLNKRDKIFGYAKDKEFDGMCIHDIPNEREGKQYMYEWRLAAIMHIRVIQFMIISMCLPLFTLLVIKFYVIASVLAVVALIAHLTRFTRRLSKKFGKHVDDKSIHTKNAFGNGRR